MKICLERLRKSAQVLTVAALICLTCSLIVVAQSQSQEAVPALEGLDPVMLVQGREVQGNIKIVVTRGRFQYFFANEEDKATFEKEPARYEIQLGGMCARMGAPVNGDPDLFTVHKEHIYIFGSGECKKLFEATPEKYLEDESTTRLTAAVTPDAVKRGHELIEKAVAAIGSPALVDGLANLQEKSTALQNRRGKEVEIKTNLIFLFPDMVRAEQVQPDFVNPSVIRETAVVMTGNDAFAVTPNGILSMPEANRLNQQHELKLRPLSILRARNGRDFQAAATGSAKVGETEVEQVLVQVDGAGHTLGIDPATGRILSLTYRRRGPGGAFGELVKVFSDFRSINGLTLPFKITATFNGQPWTEQSSSIEAIAINGKLDPALFEKPKTARAQ